MEALVNDNTPVSQKHEIAPENWVDTHGDYLFRFAFSRLQDRTSAEDLVQETFLEALHAKDAFQGKSSERTWLVSILRHKIVDHIRHVSREHVDHNGISFEDQPEEYFDEKGNWVLKPSNWGNNPSQILENKEFWSVLERCMSQLPTNAAHAFVLRELEELPYEDLSETMGISTNNLGVILYRARMRLRGCFEVNWLT